jgi:hypothetical protein
LMITRIPELQSLHNERNYRRSLLCHEFGFSHPVRVVSIPAPALSLHSGQDMPESFVMNKTGSRRAHTFGCASGGTKSYLAVFNKKNRFME